MTDPPFLSVSDRRTYSGGRTVLLFEKLPSGRKNLWGVFDALWRKNGYKVLPKTVLLIECERKSDSGITCGLI